ncbi:type VII secretion-associated serine protease mycosin [Mycobacterium noviomagense]|uniref:Membrane-anchored mycosin n=1 Tax=Mycobacterium noviomagense TaxID=459858 RepID=A0A7I7PFK9_9MYCO|nr:type VII secretion-associated serine protease mycosin [Mycobacterium noviomagense]ORB13558.1 type VII secretion-associated serine protease mycosin [Mycobacterium noviomagense]BBY07312.1 membrane-anchored mycosin [Mycobacterium noviomagense]
MSARGTGSAIFLTLIAFYAASPAHAVSPPPIDDSRLPKPALPAPPQPTVQRELCSVPSAEPGLGDIDKSGQLAGLDLPRVWELTRGSGQRVAIIDTGVSPHRRLPDMVAGGDYVSTGDGTQDCDGHGTIVAGIVAARRDLKAADHFSGVAPEATVISIRQSSTKFGSVASGSSTGVGDVDTMAKAVRTAADLGAAVINISTVACMPAESTFDDRSLGAALAYAVDVKNAVVVAAAGNTGGAGQCPAQPPQPTWDTVAVAVSPAWYDDYVLTVGSVNAQGDPSAFSIAGPWVDVAAPGEAVTSLSPVGDGMVNSIVSQSGPAPLSGTSYAAPVVSGLAALIRSRFPTLTARQVMKRIEATAHRPPGGWNPVVGNGVIDAMAAVSTDAPPTTTTRPPPENPVAIPAPAVPPRRHRTASQIAVTGAAICVVVLAAAVSTGSATAKSLRRFRSPPAAGSDDDIACD